MESITFWDTNGEAIVTITGGDSSKLLDIFDTDENRKALEDAFGVEIDCTSEEDYNDV